jgi:hypothetical protein
VWLYRAPEHAGTSLCRWLAGRPGKPQGPEGCAPEPVHGPRCHDIEPAPRHVLAQRVKAGPLITSLCTGNARVLICLRDFPAPLLGNALKLDALVVGGLLIGADSKVQGNALGHGETSSAEVLTIPRLYSTTATVPTMPR